jgi:hypothetical protein
LVASGMPAVASRNGTSAILGPIPISSSRNVSMTKAASSVSRSFIRLRPACLEIRADTGCRGPRPALWNLRVIAVGSPAVTCVMRTLDHQDPPAGRDA